MSEIVRCGSCADPLIDPLRAASPSIPQPSGGPTPLASNQTPGSGVWLQRWLLVLRCVIQAALDAEGSNPTPSPKHPHSDPDGPSEPSSKRQCTEGAHVASPTDESLSPDTAGASSRSPHQPRLLSSPSRGPPRLSSRCVCAAVSSRGGDDGAGASDEPKEKTPAHDKVHRRRGPLHAWRCVLQLGG